MERKENDLMMNVVANPSFSLEDFATIGFNIDNTSIQDKSVYRNNPLIYWSDAELPFYNLGVSGSCFALIVNVPLYFFFLKVIV